MEERKRSAIWYLLPIFMGIVGGIIGYFEVRNDDPRLAKRLLYIGLGITAISIILLFFLITSIFLLDNSHTLPSV
jgi:hypothetical protein